MRCGLVLRSRVVNNGITMQGLNSSCEYCIVVLHPVIAVFNMPGEWKGWKMDAPTALFYSTILSALITGVFFILGEVIKAHLKKGTQEEEDDKVKGKPRKKKKQLYKKFRDMPFLSRAVIIFIALAVLVFSFLYHTGSIQVAAQGLETIACPNRQNFPESEKLKEQEVWVKNGYVAYYAGWLFDGQNGGYFITFNGPYKAMHTFGNGVYCPPVQMDTALAKVTIELLAKECEASKGGCSNIKTCTQSIIGYHLIKGVCNE